MIASKKVMVAVTIVASMVGIGIAATFRKPILEPPAITTAAEVLPEEGVERDDLGTPLPDEKVAAVKVTCTSAKQLLLGEMVSTSRRFAIERNKDMAFLLDMQTPLPYLMKNIKSFDLAGVKTLHKSGSDSDCLATYTAQDVLGDTSSGAIEYQILQSDDGSMRVYPSGVGMVNFVTAHTQALAGAMMTPYPTGQTKILKVDCKDVEGITYTDEVRLNVYTRGKILPEVSTFKFKAEGGRFDFSREWASGPEKLLYAFAADEKELLKGQTVQGTLGIVQPDSVALIGTCTAKVV